MRFEKSIVGIIRKAKWYIKMIFFWMPYKLKIEFLEIRIYFRFKGKS
jgi:hypothetical protein